MLNDSPTPRPSTSVCRTAAVALFTCASTLGLSAQQANSTDVNKKQTATQLVLPSTTSLDLSAVEGVGYSSSAAPVGDADTIEAATLDFKGLPDEALQPPPRRRYGNRRYNDSSHNPDGSNKYAFLGGVGVTLPTGNLHKYDSESYGVQVGGGRNFNKNFSLMVQFDYDHFGLQGRTINNQSNLYFGANGQGLDGNSHIWSFTLDPTYNIAVSEGLGAYIVGGVGFYHKVTNFTLPEEVEFSDGFFVEEGTENVNVDHYTSNAPGFNGGFGLTFKPSRFAGERFYIEGRYVYIVNSQKQGITIDNVGTAFGQAYTGTNFYPANSNRSSYVPIKVGIRF